MIEKIVEKEKDVEKELNPEKEASSVEIKENTTAKEEKLFTQKQLEEIINDRIKRERKVNEALLPVKQLLKQFASKEKFKGKSYGEIAESLVSALTEKERKNYEEEKIGVDDGIKEPENQLIAESCQEGETEKENVITQTCEVSENVRDTVHGENVQENETDLSAQEFVNEERENKQGLAHNEQHENEDGKSQMDMLIAFKQTHPEADMNMLFDGNLFKSFAKGKNASLSEICEDYCEFLSALRSSGKTELSKDEDDFGFTGRNDTGMASTSFSSVSATAPVSAGLTKQQMNLAKEGGLSYREYAELLSSIPKGSKRA